MVKLLQRKDFQIGRIYNHLTVAGPAFRAGSCRGGYSMVVCRCVCGRHVAARLIDILRSMQMSCGCHRESVAREMGKKNTRHGLEGSNLYTLWRNMRRRCFNPKDDSFADYGARGISVCSEWLRFAAFAQWALQNGYTAGLQIDRQNNNGNYEPDNCQFVTAKRNCRNKRNTVFIAAFGEKKSLSDWADDARCAVGRQQLWKRVRTSKWTPEAAITTPPLSRQMRCKKIFA